jgi:hypothetical protein
LSSAAILRRRFEHIHQDRPTPRQVVPAVVTLVIVGLYRYDKVAV